MESGIEYIVQCCLVSKRQNYDLNPEFEESVLFSQFSAACLKWFLEAYMQY